MWVEAPAFRDDVESLARTLTSRGVDRTVLVNAHGGNVEHLREVGRRLRDDEVAYAVEWMGNAAIPLLATSGAYRSSSSNVSTRLVNRYTVAPGNPKTQSHRDAFPPARFAPHHAPVVSTPSLETPHVGQYTDDTSRRHLLS
jgi:creatinine amidohydrolase/Fe(II)-dependent formamide hydrolase-like protein